MARKRKIVPSRDNRQFWESAFDNKMTFWSYYHRLVELAISRFEWKNLPETVDPRFLELVLLSDGMVVYFDDDIIGNVVMRTMISGTLNIYDVPTRRRAYAVNGYSRDLDESNSVLIYNNYLRLPNVSDIAMYAQRLYDIDQTIDVNAKAQKTPILVQATEAERLTMQNLYKQYSGNQPFIFGTKQLNPEGLRVLKTDAPYVGDRLYELRTNIWNEALTMLGISNVSIQKRERLITDEVTRANGGTIASRYSALEARRDAVEHINDMFGTNIEVVFRDDLNTSLSDEPVDTAPLPIDRDKDGVINE